MDLQPLAFASSDAAAHDGILFGLCMHHCNSCICLLCSFGCLVSLLRPHRINLLLAISQQLQHLWTSNHLHSLPLMQLHTMAYCLGFVCTIAIHAYAYFVRLVVWYHC